MFAIEFVILSSIYSSSYTRFAGRRENTQKLLHSLKDNEKFISTTHRSD